MMNQRETNSKKALKFSAYYGTITSMRPHIDGRSDRESVDALSRRV